MIMLTKLTRFDRMIEVAKNPPNFDEGRDTHSNSIHAGSGLRKAAI